MTRDDIIRLARDAGWSGIYFQWVSPTECEHLTVPVTIEQIERFAALVAAVEREKVAAWMVSHLYATGHGDTTEDMLKELEWQIAEREREACARMCEVEYAACWHNSAMAAAKAAERCATAIRLRGGK